MPYTKTYAGGFLDSPSSLTTPITAASLNAVCDELALYNTAWTSWTPTLSGLTLGNGTLVYANYFQIGKLCAIKVMYTLGSTSNATGTISSTIPFNQAAGYATTVVSFFGKGLYTDTGTNLSYPLEVSRNTVNTIRFFALNASATYASITTMNASVPVAITTGNATSDTFQYTAIYETV